MKLPRLFQVAVVQLLGKLWIVSNRANLDFPSTGAGLQSTLTITTTGAVLGDYVEFGLDVAPEAGLVFSAQVTAADTTTITCVNNTAGAIDPAARNFTVSVYRRAS